VALGFSKVGGHGKTGHGGKQNRGETHFSLLMTRSDYAGVYGPSNLNRD
jgi:hypothetical protein